MHSVETATESLTATKLREPQPKMGILWESQAL